jgi:regulator of RNase E activity RraB
MQSPRDDGLSSDKEAPKLYEIEDALTRSFSELGAVFVGRITGDSRREFYLYSPSSQNLDTAVNKARQSFSDYVFESGSEHDPDWDQYRDVLYPSEVDLQEIQNRRVVDELEKRGDDHSIARPVDHAIYFRDPIDRSAFAAAALECGFTMHSESDHDTESERRYFLNLVRTDPVTLEHINEVVLQLFELAKQYGADYDGWGCEVQTAATTDRSASE